MGYHVFVVWMMLQQSLLSGLPFQGYRCGLVCLMDDFWDELGFIPEVGVEKECSSADSVGTAIFGEESKEGTGFVGEDAENAEDEEAECATFEDSAP